MNNKASFCQKLNGSFSFSRNKSFEPWAYGSGFEQCSGWNLLKRAIVKVVWSPCIFYGGQRREKNFAFSDFLALDFDSPETTIASIARAFADTQFIIAPTKSHMQNKNGVICERFRLVIPWTERITDVAVYRASVQRYIDHYGADRACADGARFYFPSTEIALAQDGEDGLESATIVQQTSTASELPKKYARKYREGKIVLSRSIVAFLTTGRVFGEGRMVSCFITACELRDGGVTADEALGIIASSPFNRTGFRESEIANAVKSAFSKKTKGNLL